MTHVAVDVMGGDRGPAVTVPAALHCLARDSELELTLIGNVEQMGAVAERPRLRVIDARESVTMGESPVHALRHKKGSSMHVMLELLRDGGAQAAVSAGNTGALVAISRYFVKTLAGVRRPAIVKALPTMCGHSYLLDVGANIECDTDQLVQFAVMGSTLCQIVDEVMAPRVALLNIGEEEIKGGDRMRAAAQRLDATEGVNFVGFIEADGIYRGEAEVVVTDGFVGNIALKASEGAAMMAGYILREAATQSSFRRLLALLARPILGSVAARVNPERYNGASLIGLRSTVIKSHGGANEKAFVHAIAQAIGEARQELPARIAERLKLVLP
ncbi:MAG: phosphate acyltransferase PlsX [Pseudomonadales bacterium]